MCLLNLNTVQPRQRGLAQRNRAINAGRHQANSPIPARMARWFADEVHMNAFQTIGLIVLGKRNFEWMRICTRFGYMTRNIKFNPQTVFTQLDFSSYIKIMANKLVINASKNLTVQQDCGNAIHLIQDEGQVIRHHVLRRSERPLNSPLCMIDPVHVLLIRTEIRIRDFSSVYERRMHISG